MRDVWQKESGCDCILVTELVTHCQLSSRVTPGLGDLASFNKPNLCYQSWSGGLPSHANRKTFLNPHSTTRLTPPLS